jgi:hypothetical protein
MTDIERQAAEIEEWVAEIDRLIANATASASAGIEDEKSFEEAQTKREALRRMLIEG